MRRLRAPLLCLTGLLIIGCDEQSEIEVYRAPAEPPIPTAAGGPNPHAGVGGPMMGGGVAGMPTMGDPRLITWDMPPGWALRPVAGPMRQATLVSGDGPEAIEVSVATAGGDLMANVLRWWRLLGHTDNPTPEQIAAMVTPLEGHTLEAVLVDVPGPGPEGDGPPQRTMVGAFAHEGAIWFFKTTDAADRVERHADGLRAVFDSVRPVNPPATQPAATQPATQPTP